MTVADRAAVIWHRLTCWFHLLSLVVRSWVRCNPLWCAVWGGCAGGGATSSHGPRAYRVYAFNESETDQGFYREISPRYFDSSTWEQDVRDMTGWARFRVEVRYIFRQKKYRMILRPGDCAAFPPYQEPAAPACRLPKGVLSARLQGPKGSDIDSDVTSRVLKYQGPRGDFHAGLGLTVHVHDMFPFDDNQENCSRFSHLRVMDTMARLTDLPYEENPAMRIGQAK